MDLGDGSCRCHSPLTTSADDLDRIAEATALLAGQKDMYPHCTANPNKGIQRATALQNPWAGIPRQLTVIPCVVNLIRINEVHWEQPR
jgi:hypothetical protein